MWTLDEGFDQANEESFLIPCVTGVVKLPALVKAFAAHVHFQILLSEILLWT